MVVNGDGFTMSLSNPQGTDRSAEPLYLQNKASDTKQLLKIITEEFRKKIEALNAEQDSAGS